MSSRSRLVRLIPAVLMALVLVGTLSRSAAATAITWNGTVSNAFSNPNNWSPAAVPGAGDTAIFPASGPGAVVDTSPVSLGGIQLSGGSLTLPLNDTLTITGTFEFSSGSLGGEGTLNLSASSLFLIDGPDSKNLGQVVINSAGATTWSGLGDLNVDNGFTFNNAGSFIVQNSQALTTSTGLAVFTNTGTFTKAGTSGTSTFSLQFNNSGVLHLSSGNLTLSGAGGSETTPFDLASGTRLDLDNSDPAYYFKTGSGITGSGSVQIDSATMDIPQGADITTPSGTTFNLQNPGKLQVDGSLSPNGTFNWNGGAINGLGVLRIPPKAKLNIAGPDNKSTSRLTINNNGTTTWSGSGNISGDSSTFNNSGAFIIQNDRTFNSPSDDAVFNNSGMFTKSGGTGITAFAVEFNNSGPLNINSGTLSLSIGGGRETQPFNLSAGAGLYLSGSSGGYFFGLGSGITGSGTVTIGTTVLVPRETSVSTSSGTTVILQAGGTIQADGYFTSAGVLDWTGGTIDGSGNLTIFDGGTLNIEGADPKSLSNVTLYNYGGTFWSGPGNISGDSGSTVINSGSFTIQNNATFNVFSGEASFNNTGKLIEASGSGVSNLNLNVTNTGEIDVNSGTLSFGTSFLQTAGFLELNGGSVAAKNGLPIESGFLYGAGGITGDVINAGTISPGSSTTVGTIAIMGTYTQAPGGSMNLKVGVESGTAVYDQINVAEESVLGGALSISILGNTPVDTPPLMVMNYASKTGGFSSIEAPEPVNGQGIGVTVGPSFVAVTSLATGAPVTYMRGGLSMISVPYSYTSMGGVDAAAALGLPMLAGGGASIATFDPVANRYLVYPNLPPDPALAPPTGIDLLPGRGYWIFEDSAQPFSMTGDPAPSPLTLTLPPGWNMIGDPYTNPIDFTDPTALQYSLPVTVGNLPANTLISQQQAFAAGIVTSPFFTWDQALNTYVSGSELRPWLGYWVYIDPMVTQNQPIKLTFTNPNP